MLLSLTLNKDEIVTHFRQFSLSAHRPVARYDSNHIHFKNFVARLNHSRRIARAVKWSNSKTTNVTGEQDFFVRQIDKRVTDCVGRPEVNQLNVSSILVERELFTEGEARNRQLELFGAIGPVFALRPIGGFRLIAEFRHRHSTLFVCNHVGDVQKLSPVGVIPVNMRNDSTSKSLAGRPLGIGNKLLSH